MRKALLPLLLFAWMAVPAHAGLQIDIALLGSTPIGSYSDGSDASDYFGTGGGILGDVLFGVSENLFIGGQIGGYVNSGELVDFDGFFSDYDLTSIPIHALLQFRSAGESSVGFFGQFGAGFTSHSFKISEAGFSAEESQADFSFLVGGGLAYSLSENWDLTGGLDYHQTLTPGDCDFDVFFCEDDNPKFLLFSIGARYHRD